MRTIFVAIVIGVGLCAAVVTGIGAHGAISAPPVDSPESAIAIAKQVCAKELRDLESKPESPPIKWEVTFADQTWQVEGNSGQVGSFGVAVEIPSSGSAPLRCVETVLIPGHSR